jgi:hypothetical protein
MVWYHGTYKVIHQVNLKRGNKRADFGRGFHLGDCLSTAKNWAIDRFPPNGEAPTVMCYEVDDAVFSTGVLNLRRFDEPSKEWLEFVQLNRRKDLTKTTEPRHPYDAVYGHMADDRAADTVAEYIKGIITWEEALKQIKTVPDAIQFSLHTPLALEYIKPLEVWQWSDGQWNDKE